MRKEERYRRQEDEEEEVSSYWICTIEIFKMKNMHTYKIRKGVGVQ